MARLINGSLLAAFAAGIAGGMVAPFVAPRLSRLARPGVKDVIKTGLAIYERGREAAAQLIETASDLTAEAMAEREAERQAEERGRARAVVTPIGTGRAPPQSTADG